MSRRIARSAAVAAVSALALFSAGCEKHDVVTKADTEGIWVDAGPLDYHIQGSRQLTLGQSPDKSYLAGLPQSTSQPKGDETWFAVFLRIENKTKAPAPTARYFEIIDTEGKRFRPIPLDTKENPFAYEPLTLEPNTALPLPEASETFNVDGAELLFKLPLTSYQNRPLEFRIVSPGGEPREASLDLDV